MAKDGELFYGQRYDENTDQIVRYTEQVKQQENLTPNLGTARTDVVPMDGNSSRVRIWEAPSLSAVYIEYPSTVSFNLPNVLTAIAVVFSTGAGSGSNVRELGEGAWEGDSGGMNLNPTASSTGSASAVPDIQPAITNYSERAQNVPSRNLLFYMSGSSTITSVLAQIKTLLTKTVSGVAAGVVTTTAAHDLTVDQPFTFVTVVGGSGGITAGTTYYVKTTPTTTTFTYAATAGGATLSGHSATSGTAAPTISAWPTFKPEEHTFSLMGQQVSVGANAEASLSYRWSTNAVSYFMSPAGGSDMEGTNWDVASNIRSVRLPPTIHGAISLTGGTSTTALAYASATAEIPGVAGVGGAPSFTSITSTTNIAKNATASVTPTSLVATSGTTAIPTSGLYLFDIQAQPYKLGYNQVRAILVNFNVFA